MGPNFSQEKLDASSFQILQCHMVELKGIKWLPDLKLQHFAKYQSQNR